MDEWVRVAQSAGASPVDIVALTQRVMGSRGIGIDRIEDALHVRDVGLVLEPRVVGVRGAARGGVQTTSIIRVRHPESFPEAVFEYQHSTGDSLEQALEGGIEGWVQLDLPPLADATRVTPIDCSSMKLQLPEKDGSPGYARRVVLGPPGRYGLAASSAPQEGDHCFCPCCLLTNCFEAFKPLIEGDGVYAIRLYAARGVDDQPIADCRVNGQDYDRGKSALVAYTKKWSGGGVEFRKQYVILQPDPA
jgi:hypothetical protein